MRNLQKLNRRAGQLLLKDGFDSLQCHNLDLLLLSVAVAGVIVNVFFAWHWLQNWNTISCLDRRRSSTSNLVRRLLALLRPIVGLIQVQLGHTQQLVCHNPMNRFEICKMHDALHNHEVCSCRLTHISWYQQKSLDAPTLANCVDKVVLHIAVDQLELDKIMKLVCDNVQCSIDGEVLRSLLDSEALKLPQESEIFCKLLVVQLIAVSEFKRFEWCQFAQLSIIVEKRVEILNSRQRQMTNFQERCKVEVQELDSICVKRTNSEFLELSVATVQTFQAKLLVFQWHCVDDLQVGIAHEQILNDTRLAAAQIECLQLIYATDNLRKVTPCFLLIPHQHLAQVQVDCFVSLESSDESFPVVDMRVLHAHCSP